MFKNLWSHRNLIRELIKRELVQRYSGSFLGVFWSVLIPLFMLLIYTFVFSVVFKARWQNLGEQTESTEFALILFAGITPFSIFSEVVNKSTTLIVRSPNYVKKVVFPVEIFPVVTLGAVLVTSIGNVILLILGNLILMHGFSKTFYLLPLAYIPLIFLCLGLGWFLSAIGVYIRDIAQGIPVVVQVLLFTSPIFYSASSVPSPFRFFININPLTTIIEGFRQVLLWGGPLPWVNWALWTGITFVFALLGYFWFMGTKKGFADVV